MNRFIPSFLKQFDAWLLLRYPRIWASRIHIFAFFSLIVCNLLLLAFAYLNKVSIEKLPDDKTLEMTLMLFALLSVLGVIYWFSQFKAKLKTFTYIESLLSLLLCFAVVASLMINSQLFRATTIQRVGKLMPIEQSNKDLLLLNVLDASAFEQFRKIDSIESLKLYDIEIEKNTLEKIINLSREITKISLVSDSLAEQHSRDSVTKDLLQQALKQTSISDEAKSLYLKKTKEDIIDKNIFEIKFNVIDTYLKNDLKKRYASETYTDMSFKVREIYNAQNLRWKGLMFRGYYGYYYAYNNGQNFIDTENESLKLTQDRVDILKNQIEQARFDNGSLWDIRNDNIILILFLVFALFLFFNSAWRDFIITIISFIIAFVIYVLGREFTRTNFSHDAVYFTAVLFTLLYLILAMLLWFKLDLAIQKKRIVQIILLNAVPVCYFAMLSVIEDYSRHYYESELDNKMPYTNGTILFYTLLVPVFITLYHRLSGMPKYK